MGIYVKMMEKSGSNLLSERQRTPGHFAAPEYERRRKQGGFTLLEVMVVVVILGILAVMVVPKIISRPDEARIIAAKQDVASLMQMLKLYRLDNHRYPKTEQGLQALCR